MNRVSTGKTMRPVLKTHPLFAGLNEAQLQNLYPLCHEVELPAHHVFIKENTRTTKCYIILKGSVEIFKQIDQKEFSLSK